MEEVVVEQVAVEVIGFADVVAGNYPLLLRYYCWTSLLLPPVSIRLPSRPNHHCCCCCWFGVAAAEGLALKGVVVVAQAEHQSSDSCLLA